MAKSIKKSLGQRIREIKAVSKRKKRQKQMHADKKFNDLEEMTVMDRKMLRNSIVKKLAKGKEKEGKRILKEKDVGHSPQAAIVTSEMFSCPICLEIMVEPILTPCGHAFCRPCIEQSLLHKNACSLCRESISFQSPSQSKFLKKMVEGILEPFLKSQEADEHQRRKKAYREKVGRRAIGTQIKLGYKLDFYCEGKWLQGKITALQSIKGKTMLTITSQNGHYTRKLTPESPLLAKLHSFTKASSHSSFYSSFRSLHRNDFSSLFEQDDSSNSLFFFDFGMSNNSQIFESIQLVQLPGFQEVIFPPQGDSFP